MSNICAAWMESRRQLFQGARQKHQQPQSRREGSRPCVRIAWEIDDLFVLAFGSLVLVLSLDSIRRRDHEGSTGIKRTTISEYDQQKRARLVETH
eukprot:3319228-Amphidinium_carterae.1